MRRRALLGAGVGAGVAVAGGAFGVSQVLAEEPTVEAAGRPEDAAKAVKDVFDSESKTAGGWWRAYISVAGSDGSLVAAVDQESETVLEAWSTNKIAVACAVLDKVDRGEAAIDQLLDVTEEIVSKDGDGIFGHDAAYPSHVTLGHVLANMLTVSDNTAVRLCGKVISADEVNRYLASKGFPNTQVEQKDDVADQFWLGKTTPAEQHGLLQALYKGEMVSKESSDRIFNLTQAMEAFTDGIRLLLPTPSRFQVATKAGWLDDAADERCEIGMMFDAAGAPLLTYSIYAGEQGAAGDFGAAHPANWARANMGKSFFKIVGEMSGDSSRAVPTPEYKPQNG
ncbi:MAG: serine hydrolase [Stackebrandtia sp.]